MTSCCSSNPSRSIDNFIFYGAHISHLDLDVLDFKEQFGFTAS